MRKDDPAKKELCSKYLFGNDADVVEREIRLDDEPFVGRADIDGRKAASVSIAGSDVLVDAADAMRGGRYSPDGYYNFYFTIYCDDKNRYWPDNCISFVVHDEGADDDYENWELKLSRIEQWLVMKNILALWKEEADWNFDDIFKD